MTEKTSNYFNVGSLLNEAESTKFVLQSKHEPAYGHEPVLTRLFDRRADELKELFHENYFADDETFYESSLAYRSAMVELNEERIEWMQKLEKALEEVNEYEYEKTLNNRHEKVMAIRDSMYLLKEHTALLEQSFRFPWSSCIEG